jgi:hypothetical protein
MRTRKWKIVYGKIRFLLVLGPRGDIQYLLNGIRGWRTERYYIILYPISVTLRFHEQGTNSD